MLRRSVGFFFLTVLFGTPMTANAGPIFLESQRASPTRPITIPLSTLASTAAAQRRVVVTLPSPKPDQQTLSFKVDGPKGTAISFYSSMFTPKTLTDLNPKRRVVQPGLIYSVMGSGARKVTLGESSSGSGNPGGGSSGNYECGCLTSEDVTSFIASFRAAGITYTRAQICELFTSLTFGDCNPNTSDLTNGSSLFGNTASLSVFVQRDACAAGGKQVGKAVLVFDLSKVRSDLLTEATIRIEPTFSRYSGNKQAKVKKAGDAEGKFAGRPLLLASPANGISFTGAIGEVKLNTYRKNKLTYSKTLKVADYVFYRSWLLWRVPLDGVLRGGQGTFEIRGNAAGYSLCATLSRRDQFFNGYPANTREE